MAELNGGRLLARCLANEGVRFVFGLPSPEIDPLLAALDEHAIRLVPVRHEAAGAHMAEGLYKTSGQVAVVIGNPGPGSANLLAGVITARHEGVPLVAITSQHRLGIVYPSPPSTFQGQDQLDVYKPVVKWSGPIFSWERIPEVVRLAFREMWTGRPGPVHIELPAPVLYATGDASSVRVPAPAAYRAPLPEASEARIAEVADLLAGAARPLVIAGSGVDRAGANEALLAVVERLGCPVIASMAGRAVVPLDHPNTVYGLGAGGDLAKRGVAARQPRPALRQVLGRSRDAAGGADRRRSAAHRGDAPAGARHRRRREAGAREPGGGARGEADAGEGSRLPRPLPARGGGVVEGADARGRELGRTGAAPGARDPGDRHGLRPGRDLRDRRRLHLALGVLVPAADATALISQHPRARHARHGRARGARCEARQPRTRGRVRHRRRRGRLPLHGDAVRRARGGEDHRHRLRRGLVVDGGPERADALRAQLRHRDGDGALGRRGARPRLRGPLRREPRRGRVGAREGARGRGPGGHLRQDRPRRQPGRGGGGGDAVRGGVPGADVTPPLRRAPATLRPHRP